MPWMLVRLTETNAAPRIFATKPEKLQQTKPSFDTAMTEK
jgi:hypothetical protein